MYQLDACGFSEVFVVVSLLFVDCYSELCLCCVVGIDANDKVVAFGAIDDRPSLPQNLTLSNQAMDWAIQEASDLGYLVSLKYLLSSSTSYTYNQSSKFLQFFNLLESISLFLALIYLRSKPQIPQFFNLLQSISLFLALIYLQSKPQIQQFFNLLQSVSLPHMHITTIETSDPAILQPLAKASLSLPRNHTPK
jgi:hypothetical protein